MVSTRITLTLSRILVERVSDAAKLDRRAIVAARRTRQAKQGERCR